MSLSTCIVLAALAGIIVSMETDDTWVLSTDSLPMKDEKLDLRYMASVGNGHIATVVYGPTVYMNGLYNGPQGWSHRAAIQSQHDVTLTVPGETGKRHSLDMWRGMFTTTIESTSVTVEQRTYAHQHYTQMLVTEVVLTRRDGVEVDVTVAVSRSEMNSTIDLVLDLITEHTSVERCPGTCYKTRGMTQIPESNKDQLREVFIYWTQIPDSVTLPADTDSKTWTFFTCIDSDKGQAETAFRFGAERLNEADPGALVDSHVAAWANKWNQGRMDVGGNEELSRLVHSSLYYILSSLPSTDPSQPNEQFYGLSPGGLANGANWTDYQGHVFWDMETWMYPPVLMLFPDLAKSMLSYRIYGMRPAYERAESGDYEGLRYPWESAATGVEQTPDICPACRDNQQHITADIAFAARQYVVATRDVTWLREQKGYTFIRDMAKFWKTRPSWNPEKEAFEINGVMPPDEHAIYINNSIYTNVGAQQSIQFARYAACLTGSEKIGEVAPDWLNVADKLYIPYDDIIKYHPEYEGYDYRQTVNDSNIVKQADVILLGYPLMYEMPDEVRRNDLTIYENVTTPEGPAMTWSMFAINWLELGDKVKAAQMLDKSHSLYTREPFKVWTEARSGIGAVNFITGMGGFLQAVMFGYGGARLHTETLDFDPHLPPDATSLRFIGLDYLGNSFDLDIFDSSVVINLKHTTESLHRNLRVKLGSNGTVLTLVKAQDLRLPRAAFTLYTDDVSDCPLPAGSSCPEVVSRSEWGATESTPRGSVQGEPYVVVYQTGGEACTNMRDCKAAVASLQKSMRQAGQRNVVHNFILGTDGRVYEGTGWDAVGDFNEDFNTRAIGITVIGDFTTVPPPREVLTQMKLLIKCGMEKGKIASNYTLLWEKQLEPPSCTQCAGDKLFCQLINFRHWTNHQQGGEFIAPNCDLSHVTQKPTPPTSATPSSSSGLLLVAVLLIFQAGVAFVKP